MTFATRSSAKINLSRRAFGGGLLAAPLVAGGLTLGATSAGASTNGRLALPLPHAAVQIGRFTVHVLTDGHVDLPYGVFTGQNAEETAAHAEAAHMNGPNETLRIGFAAYLIDDGERLILVDSGPAGGIGQNTGKLPSALAAIGVVPADIDAIILTHTHFDHISGAIAGGQAVFSNAEVYVDRRDIAHFTDAGKRASAPDLLLSSFDTTANLVRLYPRLQQVDGDQDIAPGIQTVDLTGHTPGHIGVRVSDAGQSMLMVSDMLFHPVLHPSRSDVGIAFEQDPAAAKAMRARFFPLAAGDGSLIAATHMPFPGLGRIGRDGNTLRWIPENWAYALAD